MDHLCYRFVYYAFLLNLFLITTKSQELTTPCTIKLNNAFECFGELILTENDFEICAFYGIPYAEAPIGDLRFELPILKDVSESMNFSLKNDQLMCPQQDEVTKELIGDEDCLYLNVYLPSNILQDAGTTLPVFFWIHGGSFIMGSSNSDYNKLFNIVEQNVIVVTHNYRLGSLGFLAIPKFQMLANLGLKDQVTAMKWVQKNINDFHSDSRRVTIVGWSAGSASVTYHLYSNMSSGLFQRAIAMSGSFLNPWAFSLTTDLCGEKFMEYFPNATSKDDLKELNLTDIFRTYSDNLEFLNFCLTFYCFLPVVESPDHYPNGTDLFLTESPLELFQKPPVNDVPLMIGFTVLEIELYLPDFAYIVNTQNVPNKNESVHEAIKTYIIDYDATSNRKNFMSKLCSTSDIIYGIQLFTNDYGKHAESPLFAYRFEYDGKFGFFKTHNMKKFKNRNRYGAIHGDDLGYLFEPSYNVTTANREAVATELLVSERVLKMWTNFVKYGNPTPNLTKAINVKWMPFKKGKRVMEIDTTLKMTENSNKIFYYNFWNTIYQCLYLFECEFFEKYL